MRGPHRMGQHLCRGVPSSAFPAASTASTAKTASTVSTAPTAASCRTVPPSSRIPTTCGTFTSADPASQEVDALAVIRRRISRFMGAGRNGVGDITQLVGGVVSRVR